MIDFFKCYKSRILFILALMGLCLTFAGCKKTTQVVLTTDFDPEEVFRIEDKACTVPEVMVYMVNTENQYDEVFGNGIWNVPFGNGTVESQYKESVLARLSQIKAMNLYADSHGIRLESDEEYLCKKAASEYFASLSQVEKQELNITEDLIYNMYSEYALANKVYEKITESVNPEISDDEARSVTIKSLLIKTYSTDLNGNVTPYTDAMRQDAYKRAYSALLKIRDGVDFDVVSADYNEDTKSVYSFGRGVMPEEIEETAYNLSEGQVSDVIETDYGFHILKCVSNFDEEQTDLNKIQIVKKRKEEAFTEEYDGFISSLTSNLNEDLWKGIKYERNPGIVTTSFFQVYDDIFYE